MQVSEKAKNNRKEIADLMRSHGFIAYPWEFWHFSCGDVYAAYFTNNEQDVQYGPVDWDPLTNVVTPMSDASKPLVSLLDIQEAIDAAVES